MGKANLTALIMVISFILEAKGLPTALEQDEAVSILLTELQKRSSSNPKLCEGRLTLTSGTAVTTSDVTGASTVYFTPFGGSRISVFSGTQWTTFSFSELSVAVPATTVTPFDIFAYDNGGSVALSTTSWTNDTTRATSLARVEGVYVKSGATGYRYLGTGRTTSVSGQTEDSVSKRFLWNYYNRRSRVLRVTDSTASWSYATTVTFEAVNATSANRVELVVGVKEVFLRLHSHGVVDHVGEGSMGIGANSSSAHNTDNIGCYLTIGVGGKVGVHSSYSQYPDVGYNYYQWTEVSSNGASITFYGGPSADNNRMPGLTGRIDG